VGPPSQLLTLARHAAEARALDPGLVCAVIEQESAWNPWAMRYEPVFFTKYVAPLYTNNKISATEAYARGFSWGLMQVMGQVAREIRFSMRSFFPRCAIRSKPSPSAAKYCARSSTPPARHDARPACLEWRRQCALSRAGARPPRHYL